jgi:hypothetical protein
LLRHPPLRAGCAGWARGDCIGDWARADCAGDPVARAPGAAVLVLRAHCGRGPTTARALTGRNVCPVAEATCATGGPNAPPREGMARGLPSGEARCTMTPVCWTATTCTGMGCVKCSARTATQPGCRNPNPTNPRGPMGAQAQYPKPQRQVTHAGAQTRPGTQNQPTPPVKPQVP